MVQEEMPFKGIPYLDIWQPFCSAECYCLCNFARGYYEEQFCEIILNLGQWFRRCCLKDFLSGALAALLFGGGNNLCNFKRGHHRHSCEVIWNLDQWFKEEMSFKDISYLELWQPFCSVDWNHLCNIGRRHHEEKSYVINLNLNQWFRRKWGLK